VTPWVWLSRSAKPSRSSCVYEALGDQPFDATRFGPFLSSGVSVLGVEIPTPRAQFIGDVQNVDNLLDAVESVFHHERFPRIAVAQTNE